MAVRHRIELGHVFLLDSIHIIDVTSRGSNACLEPIQNLHHPNPKLRLGRIISCVPVLDVFVTDDCKKVMEGPVEDGRRGEHLDACRDVGVPISYELEEMLWLRHGSHVVDEQPLLCFVGGLFSHQIFGHNPQITCNDEKLLLFCSFENNENK